MLSFFNETVTMDKKVGVILPCECLYSEKYINKFLITFSQMFGGASVVDITGGYVMQDEKWHNTDKLVVEKNVLVYAYYSEMDDTQAADIALLIDEAKHELNQECIGVEYEGKFTLVF